MFESVIGVFMSELERVGTARAGERSRSFKSSIPRLR